MRFATLTDEGGRKTRAPRWTTANLANNIPRTRHTRLLKCRSPHPAGAVDVNGLQARCRTRIHSEHAACVEPNSETRRALLVSCCFWSGRRDSNSRPPVPKTGALPDCATPRLGRLNTAKKIPLAIRLCPSIRSFVPARVQRIFREPWTRRLADTTRSTGETRLHA